MISMIEDHYTKDQTTRSKNIMRLGAKDHGLGGPGPKPQKRGGPGGGPKNRQILHTGGEIWGGCFWGGPEKQGS